MTRYIIKIIDSIGKTKIVYWGNGDGYPEYMGVGILEFLHNHHYKDDLEYRVTKNIKVISDESETTDPLLQAYIKSRKDGDNVYTIAPFCPHSCGVGLLTLLLYGKLSVVMNAWEGEDWDGFYTINFKKRTFTTEYRRLKKSYSLEKLPTSEAYLADFKKVLD